MTKQEALEVILERCRMWEQSAAEVPARNPRWVARQMQVAARALDVVQSDGQCPEQQEALIVVGAAALYLLRDEVDVVGLPQLTADLDEALARWTGDGGRAAAH